MMIATLCARLNEGRACLNGWSLLPCAATVETFVQAGWDSITFDMQHGMHDYASVLAALRTVQRFASVPLVRTVSNDAGMMGKLLDAGAWGIICPMINTAADAAAMAKACLYPPAGERSYGPVRAAGYGGAEPYATIANNRILVLPQIETRQAIDNLDAILDTPGISGVYVGPSDLGISYGLGPGLDRKEEAVLALYRRLVAAAVQRGKVAAIHCGGSDYASFAIELGFTFVTVASDIALLTQSARQTADAARPRQTSQPSAASSSGY